MNFANAVKVGFANLDRSTPGCAARLYLVIARDRGDVVIGKAKSNHDEQGGPLSGTDEPGLPEPPGAREETVRNISAELQCRC